MSEPGNPIAYSALKKGVRVVSRSGREFGTVERVLEVPGARILHGIAVATPHGLRLVARKQVAEITTARVTCALSDEEAATLPAASEEASADAPPRRPAGRWFVRGGSAGPVVVARCQRGSLFETVWIPLGSFKAIRLGPFRIQRCPVHDRVEVVQIVDQATLSAEERAQAARYPASRIP